MFRTFSIACSNAMGSAWAFVAACLGVLIWGVSGPGFGFSDTWQLVINTATTVLTFLAVFLIQNTQNRDAKAIHLKLDELIRAVEGARTGLVDLEKLPDEDIEEIASEFEELHQDLREVKRAEGMSDESADRPQRSPGSPSRAR